MLPCRHHHTPPVLQGLCARHNARAPEEQVPPSHQASLPRARRWCVTDTTMTAGRGLVVPPQQVALRACEAGSGSGSGSAAGHSLASCVPTAAPAACRRSHCVQAGVPPLGPVTLAVQARGRGAGAAAGRAGGGLSLPAGCTCGRALAAGPSTAAPRTRAPPQPPGGTSRAPRRRPPPHCRPASPKRTAAMGRTRRSRSGRWAAPPGTRPWACTPSRRAPRGAPVPTIWRAAGRAARPPAAPKAHRAARGPAPGALPCRAAPAGARRRGAARSTAGRAQT